MVLHAFFRTFPLSPLTVAPLLLLGVACGGSPADPAPTPDSGGVADGATCQTFVPPPSFNASAPTVSFANDVLPIFSLSCAFSSCHGSTTGSQGSIYLGTRGAVVYANLVGVASTELATMVRVKPGDPENSFLLRRIDGDACVLAGCTTSACKELMPQGGPALPQEKLLAIRAWISQGALNDLPDAGPAADAGLSDASLADASDGSATHPSDAAGD